MCEVGQLSQRLLELERSLKNIDKNLACQNPEYCELTGSGSWFDPWLGLALFGVRQWLAFGQRVLERTCAILSAAVIITGILLKSNC